jgi:hypothetical protein
MPTDLLMGYGLPTLIPDCNPLLATIVSFLLPDTTLVFLPFTLGALDMLLYHSFDWITVSFIPMYTNTRTYIHNAIHKV